MTENEAMAGAARPARRSDPRVGSAVLAVIDAALLLAVHVWPGWAALPFLTAETTQVLGVFTASLVLGLAVHALGAAVDLPRLRTAGDAATSAVGIVVAVRVWQVFPFRFEPSAFDWALLVRALLVLGMVGGAIGVLAGVAALVRAPRP